MSLNKKLYISYINSPSWKKIKDRILIERNICECCGEKNNIQVHHKTYKNITEELDEDLLVVCENCHNKIHTLASWKHSTSQEDINEWLKLLNIQIKKEKEKLLQNEKEILKEEERRRNYKITINNKYSKIYFIWAKNIKYKTIKELKNNKNENIDDLIKWYNWVWLFSINDYPYYSKYFLVKKWKIIAEWNKITKAYFWDYIILNEWEEEYCFPGWNPGYIKRENTILYDSIFEIKLLEWHNIISEGNWYYSYYKYLWTYNNPKLWYKNWKIYHNPITLWLSKLFS